ncbi:MAG: energy-coupling factor transporter transmembrane component T [Thermomicrobiales bacterium]
MSFDVRSWLVWGGAAFLVALLARNPFVVIELGILVLTVRYACVPPERLVGIGWMLKLAPVMLAIGVVFNVLTVRAGNQVMVALPASWPLIGGDVTWNALAYGVVGAMALFVLLLVGTTLGALTRWIDLTRILPQRVASLAVAGSVAWVFLPELARAFGDIRETMTLRGMPIRGPRTALPLIVPLLAQGLERAMTTAEVLETRGLGGQPQADGRRSAMSADLVLIGGLVALLAACYDVFTGGRIAWPILLAVAVLALGVGLVRRPGATRHRTRYRDARWQARDTITCAGAILVVALFLWRWTVNREALVFDPYPDLLWPTVDLATMLALPLLAVPAFVAAFSPLNDR